LRIEVVNGKKYLLLYYRSLFSNRNLKSGYLPRRNIPDFNFFYTSTGGTLKGGQTRFFETISWDSHRLPGSIVIVIPKIDFGTNRWLCRALFVVLWSSKLYINFVQARPYYLCISTTCTTFSVLFFIISAAFFPQGVFSKSSCLCTLIGCLDTCYTCKRLCRDWAPWLGL
jgi:hypothetical protein